MSLREIASNWYAFLSTFNATVAMPLRDLADGINLPLVSALIFGLIGATSPCQLTTNAGALAYVARAGGGRGSAAVNALAYLTGKVVIYTLVGMAVIVVGRELAQQSIPVIVAARKVLGPLMILMGLYLLGLVAMHVSLGGGLSSWLEKRAGSGAGGAFVLGAAFSFAFCPTLFLLFFGLTIPLALASPVGVIYPGAFAVGTTLPLLALAGLLTVGLDTGTSYVQGALRAERWLRPGRSHTGRTERHPRVLVYLGGCTRGKPAVPAPGPGLPGRHGPDDVADDAPPRAERDRCGPDDERGAG
jgi:cytochrome c-type biogenesis protein